MKNIIAIPQMAGPSISTQRWAAVLQAAWAQIVIPLRGAFHPLGEARSQGNAGLRPPSGQAARTGPRLREALERTPGQTCLPLPLAAAVAGASGGLTMRARKREAPEVSRFVASTPAGTPTHSQSASLQGKKGCGVVRSNLGWGGKA